MNLTVVPVTLREANRYVEQNHRHHGSSRGHKFSVGLHDGNKLVGVAIAGRPVARGLDNGKTLEILRVCTDQTENACSMLIGACRRAATAMGYTKVVTYTLISENGSSIRAAGFRQVAQTAGGSWNSEKRPREDKHPLEPKIRWEWP